jgi:lysophospholipase L1-like esterase
MSNQFCRAAAWVRFRKQDLPLFPLLAAKYFLIFVLFATAGLAITEMLLEDLSTKRIVVSNDWAIENIGINEMNLAKLSDVNTENPIWRSQEIPPPSPETRKNRILVLGDSFVWGDGYSNANDIWWRQLDRELKRRGYYDVEIVAAGLNGASTQDQLRWLRELNVLNDVHADLVILGYVTNDADVKAPNGRSYVKQFGRDLRMPTWRLLDSTVGRVAPTLVSQIKPKLSKKWASQVKDAYEYTEWELRLLDSPNIDKYAEIVDDLGAYFSETDVPIFAVSLPIFPSAEHFSPRYGPIKPIFQGAGIPFFDLLDTFSSEYENNGSVLTWGINPANSHPGPLVTRFYARQVADILERDYAGLIGPRSSDAPLLTPEINDWMPPSARAQKMAPGTWTLSYPSPGEAMPRLPLDEPHVILSFELPVAIESIQLHGDGLKRAGLWITTVDPDSGASLQDPKSLGYREGNRETWTLDDSARNSEVNALSITAEFLAPQPDRVKELSTSDIQHRRGFTYVVRAPELQSESDDGDHPDRSPWVLLEDGTPLGPPHSLHAPIDNVGLGRWSHWQDTVMFSTSDNTDPRVNGRSYRLVTYHEQGRELSLHIQFAEVAVRP